jgi:hypothetical protein
MSCRPATISCNHAVLGSECCSHGAGIERRAFFILLDGVCTFLNRTFHAVAVLSAGFPFQNFEDLLEAKNLLLGLFKVCGKEGLQLGMFGALSKLRKRSDELVFRTIHIAEFID